MTNKLRKVFETLIIVFITATILYFIPTFIKQYCFEIQEGTKIAEDGIRYQCPEGFYNPIATLLFNPLATEFRLLMDAKTIFSYQALIIYFVVWYILTILSYGTNVPAGAFVSGILIGCSFGRIVAMFVHDYLGQEVHVPSYAVIGAVTLLAGYARHTFSLAVIMMESTENINLFLPMVYSMFISYCVAGIYNRSIYINSLRSKNIPWLLEFAPVMNSYVTADLMMKGPVKSLKPVSTVKDI